MKPDSTHEGVRESYTEMLKGAREKAVSPAAQLAGYQDMERHADAAAASFGCGNPLAFAGVQEGDTVLDLGSGAGLDLLLAAEKTGLSGRVIGVDMTEAMVQVAADNARRAGASNVDVRFGMIEDLPVDAGSVDWVISNCVINLSPDKPRVFSEIHRVLKPGGQFSISDIVVEQLPDWIRESAAAWSACVAGAISEDQYVAGLCEAGLAEVQVIERLVYERSQLGAILSEDIPGLDLGDDLINTLLDDYVGTVWSAKFTGRKP